MSQKTKTYTFIKENKFIASKKMGQNFLINNEIVQKIIDQIPNLNNFESIIEIGPGLGSITKHLINFSMPTIAIELDKRLYSYIKQNVIASNFQIINDDFLKIDLKEMLKQYNSSIIIANIPYSITSPIILKLIKEQKVKTIYIMVQKEVADKLNYKDKRNRNAFTNFLNLYFDYSKNFDINKNAFNPKPKVDSSIITLNRKNDLPFNNEYFLFLKNIFKFKRKKITNNFDERKRDHILKILLDLKINTNSRAEELDNDQLFMIFEKIKDEAN